MICESFLASEVAGGRMSESSIKIRNISVAERCEVCHKSDMFDPETRHCGRCKQIALTKATVIENLITAPLPEFLIRRFGVNVAIRCSSCGEFIMSRAVVCRHCGTYVRLDEASRATQDERRLTAAFERLHHCKGAASLSWEFLRIHLWGFPLTLLLTPLSAVGSFFLFLRTLWLALFFRLTLSMVGLKEDKRVKEGRRESFVAAAKSLCAFALAASIALTVLYSGLAAIPQFWDTYSKGRQEYGMCRYKEAERLFQEAVRSNPGNLEAQIYYARSIWNQFVPNINADKAKNQDLATRAIREFSNVLKQTEDLKIKDQVYNQIAEIYRATNERSRFEQWMLDRASLPNQTGKNQVDAFINLGTAYANDISLLADKYQIKNRYPRAWHPAGKWTKEDADRARDSAAKAIDYLKRALALAPDHQIAKQLLEQLNNDLLKVKLSL
jgi:tetratricopeptide (TPR) repeat protein